MRSRGTNVIREPSAMISNWRAIKRPSDKSSSYASMIHGFHAEVPQPINVRTGGPARHQRTSRPEWSAVAHFRSSTRHEACTNPSNLAAREVEGNRPCRPHARLLLYRISASLRPTQYCLEPAV
jgi:hypothetical protein